MKMSEFFSKYGDQKSCRIFFKQKREEPIWLMMQKIRISMGHRDDKYQLVSCQFNNVV